VSPGRESHWAISPHFAFDLIREMGLGDKQEEQDGITQHIPDKGAQMVRYYGWYSNKMRPAPPCPERRRGLAARETGFEKVARPHSTSVAHRSADPPAVPATDARHCVIDQRVVIEKILRHPGQWNGTPPLAPARSPPDAGASTREPCAKVDPMPDYENVLTD
jgi:hypothetical protein